LPAKAHFVKRFQLWIHLCEQDGETLMDSKLILTKKHNLTLSVKSLTGRDPKAIADFFNGESIFYPKKYV